MNRRNLPRLRRRILAQHQHMAAHADEQLAPAAARMGSFHAPPPQVQTMPYTVVIMTADAHTVSEAWPLYAGPRGAPIPATGPGQWVQVHAAGRP